MRGMTEAHKAWPCADTEATLFKMRAKKTDVLFSEHFGRRTLRKWVTRPRSLAEDPG